MIRHIAPHRWADAASGRLDAAQVAKLEEHAAHCPRCAAARQRVLAAREAFDDIREQDAPQLHWDHIGARIYWVTSSEQRAAGREEAGRRFAPWVAFAGAGAVAVAAVVAIGLSSGWFGGDSPGAPQVADQEVAQPAPAPAEAVHPIDVAPADEPAAQLRGVVTFAQGDVSVNGAPLTFDEPVGVGERIATGEGRVAVQFGSGSGFSLAEKSTLVLRSFDERTIELVVDGGVSVEVARRASDQRFAVIAGDRTVTVRGTAFRVEHRDGGLEVACGHGHVVLSDDAGELDLLAGDMVQLSAADAVLKARARHLRAKEIETLERIVATPMLPAWTDAETLYATSGTLQLAAPADRVVEVDGIERGQGAFLLRVMSGRHHVDADGRAGEWLEIGAGGREEVLRAAPAAGAKTRRAQVAKALGKSDSIRRCLRPLEKQGLLDGSFIVLDLGVNRDGRLGHLNIVTSNMPLDVARCVRNRVDNVALPTGPQATVRYRLEY